MPWLHETPGTVTQWAVEHTYDDGERRYFTDYDDEAEAKEAAEIANLERLRSAELGENSVVSCRVVSRQITYTDWR